ncbi:MAG: hypothetical protein IPO97_10165 [Sphingomonadales bacterium]|nr:hypothetical protein [Sphingomonadales bacterium]
MLVNCDGSPASCGIVVLAGFLVECNDFSRLAALGLVEEVGSAAAAILWFGLATATVKVLRR